MIFSLSPLWCHRRWRFLFLMVLLVCCTMAILNLRGKIISDIWQISSQITVIRILTKFVVARRFKISSLGYCIKGGIRKIKKLTTIFHGKMWGTKL